jgi:hypothetical protein
MRASAVAELGVTELIAGPRIGVGCDDRGGSSVPKYK